MLIHHLDPINGSDANNGTTWALAWRTITSGATAARIAPGDIIRIAKSPDPTSLGVNATWTNLSRTVTLASALTANVEMCDATWTGVAANVTQAVTTTRKEGANAIQFTIAAAFTTGKVAWRTIPQTDFSAFQQLSFWFRTSVAIGANVLRVCLCSDDLGDVIVDSFIIPAMPGINRFASFTINKGSALGSAIRSVAVYADIDPGTPVIILDNIIAVRPIGSPNSLSLTSLISKNNLAQGGTEGWFGIKSINGTTIELDIDTESLAGTGRGYFGTTETVMTFKRETIKTTMVAASTTVVQEIMDSGTLGNNIQFQGGWDTATTIQNGETFFDGQNGLGRGLFISARHFITINRLSFYKYWDAVFNVNSNNDTKNNLFLGNNSNLGILYSFCNNNIVNNAVINNNVRGVEYSTSHKNTINNLISLNSNNSDGIDYITSNNNEVNGVNIRNNGSRGIDFGNSNNNVIRFLSSSDSGSMAIFNNFGINYLFNASIAETVEVGGITAFVDSRIFSQNHDGITNNHWIFTDGGTINSQTAVRHSPTGIAWRLSPTSSDRSISYPLYLSVARIAVAAGSPVTIRCWMRRSSTALTLRLIVRGRQIAGVDSDVFADVTAAADTWQEIILPNFTPTATGVIEVEAWAWGGVSNHGFCDDFSVTQP